MPEMAPNQNCGKTLRPSSRRAHTLFSFQFKIIERRPVVRVGVIPYPDFDVSIRYLDVVDRILPVFRYRIRPDVVRELGPPVTFDVQLQSLLSSAGARPNAGLVPSVGDMNFLGRHLLVGSGRPMCQ